MISIEIPNPYFEDDLKIGGGSLTYVRSAADTCVEGAGVTRGATRTYVVRWLIPPHPADCY